MQSLCRVPGSLHDVCRTLFLSCLPRLQGQPLLSSKQAGADGEGRLVVPLTKGCATLPEMSITGEHDCLFGCLGVSSQHVTISALKPQRRLPGLPAGPTPAAQAAARRCCQGSGRPLCWWCGRWSLAAASAAPPSRPQCRMVLWCVVPALPHACLTGMHGANGTSHHRHTSCR